MAATLTLLAFDQAQGGLRFGVPWYTASTDDRTRERAAHRYEVGMGGKREPDPDKTTIRALNPSFRWFIYNSGNDNYITGQSVLAEHEALVQLAFSRGWDPEEFYLHYYDDTRIALGRETVLIPGWGGGSAHKRAEARVPVYSPDRRLVNFSTRKALQLHKELMIQLALDTPFAGSSLYPDGILLDNCGTKLYNYGRIISGGHVGETPGRLSIMSPEFQAWYWNDNLAPFLTSLKDTLEVSATWSRDRTRKFLMVNVATQWNDAYVTRDVADILTLEFQYNPVQATGQGAVGEAYRRDALAAAAGIASFYLPAMTRTVEGREGSYTYAEALLNNLSFYLVTRTRTTLFYELGTTIPSAAGWDTLTWRGCTDVAKDQLGEAVGLPYVLASGIDPLGNSYEVYARKYENGLAVVRNRWGSSQGIEPQTAVTVRLPGRMRPVNPAGVIGPPIEASRLRNGQGAFFLANVNPVSIPEDHGMLREPLLKQNSPNPFHNDTRIRFETSTPSHVTLRVFDMRGRLIRRVFDRIVDAGSHTATWNGLDDSGRKTGAGVYIYRLDTPSGSLSNKLQLIP